MGELFRILKSMNLVKLLRGWQRIPGAAERAAERIKKGESPYYVMSEENGIPMDPTSRRKRGIEQGYTDEDYHGTQGLFNEDDSTFSALDRFQQESHFGSLNTAHNRLTNVAEQDHLKNFYGDYSSIYPVRLKDRHKAVETEDLGSNRLLSIKDFDDRAKEMNPDKPFGDPETLKYENFIEDDGALSFINRRENVRGRFAAHNPHWRLFKDLLATGVLSTLPFIDEQE
jgi:hypothetical protein